MKGEPRGSRGGNVRGETSWQAGTLPLRGERLCLDCANTASWHAGDHPVEWLTSYAALVAWGRHAGAVSDDEAARLLHEAAERPVEAAVVLARAIALREAIYHTFAATAAGRAPEASALATLNRALPVALAHAQIVPAADSFTWTWDDAAALDRPLWPVARSAADLLTSGELSRVRECAGYPCGWLFVDLTKNHSRRWCDTQGCGNRARVRQHHARRRADRARGDL